MLGLLEACVLPLSLPGFGPRALGQIANHIRTLWHHVQTNTRMTAQATEESSLWLHWLEHYSQNSTFASTLKGRFGQKTFQMEKLLHAFLTAELLRDRGSLLEVVSQGLRLVFDGPSAQAFTQYLHQGAQASSIVPSAATISRHQLTIHVAWLRLQQEKFAEIQHDSDLMPIWTLMADSSPQGGRDYLNFVAEAVPCGKLAEVFEATHTLLRVAAAEEMTDGDVEAEEASLNFKEAFVSLPLPPVVLGSKRGTAPHKMHGLLHSLRLIMPDWKSVLLMVRHLVSVTSDLGVEKLLARSACVPLSSYFSRAVPPSAEEEEEDFWHAKERRKLSSRNMKSE